MRSFFSSQRFLGWLVLFASLLFISLLWNSPQSIYFTNDGASTVAVAKGMLSGEFPLAGPPAARGGRHFGPWYFYWECFFLLLSGGDISNAVLFETIGKALLLSLGCLLLLEQLVAPRWLLASAIGASLAFLSGSWWWTLRTPWHSNFVTVACWPLLLLLLRSIHGNLPRLPLLMLVGSLTFQTHLATAPLVLCCGGMTLLCMAWKMKTSRLNISQSSTLLLWCCCILSWVPSLLYHFQIEGGLFGEEGGGSPNAPREGLLRSLFLSGRVFRRFSIGDTDWSALLSPLPAWTGILLQLLFLLFLIQSFVRGNKSLRLLLLSLLGSAFGYVLVIAILRRPVHPHYESSILILIPLFVGLAISEAARTLGSSYSEGLDTFRRVVLFAAASCFLLLSSLTSAHAIRLNLQALHQGPFPKYQTLGHAEEYAALLQKIGLDPDKDGFLINESDRLRESAVFLFLGEQFFPKMQYAKHFHELSRFSRRNDLKTERLFLISCEAVGNKQVERHLANYHLEKQYDLSECMSCTSCSLSSWRENGN